MSLSFKANVYPRLLHVKKWVCSSGRGVFMQRRVQGHQGWAGRRGCAFGQSEPRALAPKRPPSKKYVVLLDQGARPSLPVVGVHVTQGLSCPRLGQAPPTHSSLSQVAPCLGRRPAAAGPFPASDGRTAGEPDLSKASSAQGFFRLPRRGRHYSATFRGHCAFFSYSKFQGDVLSPQLSAWLERVSLQVSSFKPIRL